MVAEKPRSSESGMTFILTLRPSLTCIFSSYGAVRRTNEHCSTVFLFSVQGARPLKTGQDGPSRLGNQFGTPQPGYIHTTIQARCQ